MLATDTFARLCRARDLLREVHDRPLTIDDVAREAAMSPFHFIRRFHPLFGDTPHQFRVHSRLERAKELLALHDDPVTAICMEVGFSSLGSFSHLFAQRVGVPPSTYRRRARSMIVVPGRPPVELFPGCFNVMAAAFAIFEKH